jgi:hypothetical protein
MVRVKRKRDRASASSLVLEIESSARGSGRNGLGDGTGTNGNDDEDDARAAMRRRASALASALDAVLEGGSTATPYGAEARDEGRPRGKRRKRCARVAAGVTRGDDRAADVDAVPDEGGRKRERAKVDVNADVYGAAKRLALGGEGGGAYRVVDVLVDSNGDAHAGEEDIKRAEEAEAVLMCNYAPMVREYLAKTTGEVPQGLGEREAKEAKEAGDDWVYDVYVMDDDDNVEDDDEGDETTPVIRVKDLSDAFDWEENVESDYGDSDSNAEDYFENDYPDTEETESERGWSDDSFDSDDGERRMDDYY